jgi:hypothetical protein
MSRPSGMTIILVGGVFTTDDGVSMDSRQPTEGDPTCQVLYRSLSRSHLWWETVRSVVDPIIRDAGDGYAVVDGPHQIFDLASGGGIKRVSLADLLAVGSPESHWRFPFDEHPDVEGLREIYRNASALVDISQAGKSGSAVLSSFSARERRNPSMVLVVPHTHALQEFFGHVALAGQGEEAQAAYRDANSPTRPRWGGAPDPLAYAAAVPVQAEFKVTGLLYDGAWQDPSGFEAARALLQARYDLTLGIWDLASNPTLRATLLDVAPVKPAPPVEVPVPAAASARATSKLDKEIAIWEEWAARLKPIIDAGWVRRRGGGVSFAYVLAGGDALVQNPSPQLSLWLALSKTQATVRLQSRIQEVYMHEGLQQYLVARRELFEQIATPFACDLEANTPAIWLAPGGTATEGVDWDERGRAIAECTRKWMPAFADLVAECRRIEAIPAMERMLHKDRVQFNPLPK